MFDSGVEVVSCADKELVAVTGSCADFVDVADGSFSESPSDAGASRGTSVLVLVELFAELDEGDGVAVGETVGLGEAVGAAPKATNVAVVDFAAVNETVQVVLRLEHAPLHPPNSVPVTGIAVNVTEVEFVKP